MLNQLRLEGFSMMSDNITMLVRNPSNTDASLSGSHHENSSRHATFTRHDVPRLSAFIRGVQDRVHCWPFQGKILVSLNENLKVLREIDDEEYGLGEPDSKNSCNTCQTTLWADVHRVADDIEYSLKALRICLHCVRLGQRESCEICRKWILPETLTSRNSLSTNRMTGWMAIKDLSSGLKSWTLAKWWAIFRHRTRISDGGRENWLWWAFSMDQRMKCEEEYMSNKYCSKLRGWKSGSRPNWVSKRSSFWPPISNLTSPTSLTPSTHPHSHSTMSEPDLKVCARLTSWCAWSMWTLVKWIKDRRGRSPRNHYRPWRRSQTSCRAGWALHHCIF